MVDCFDVGIHGFFSRFFLFPQLSFLLYNVYSHLKNKWNKIYHCLGMVLKLLSYLLKDTNFKNFLKSEWELWHYIGEIRKNYCFSKSLNMYV